MRNSLEEPAHALGAGKFRPVVLVFEVRRGWWAAIGATSKNHYADGNPRRRIPAELWELAYPDLWTPGYLWGNRMVFLPAHDIGDLIGLAPPELRAFVMAPIINSSPSTRNDFLRLTEQERPLAQVR